MSPTLLALGLGLLAYVLPVDRVLLQLGLDRERTPPLHVQATLAGIGEDWPEQVFLDLHPELGFRVAGWSGKTGKPGPGTPRRNTDRNVRAGSAEASPTSNRSSSKPRP